MMMFCIRPAHLVVYSVGSLKRQSTEIYDIQHGHIILLLIRNVACLALNPQIPIICSVVLDMTQPGIWNHDLQ